MGTAGARPPLTCDEHLNVMTAGAGLPLTCDEHLDLDAAGAGQVLSHTAVVSRLALTSRVQGQHGRLLWRQMKSMLESTTMRRRQIM